MADNYLERRMADLREGRLENRIRPRRDRPRKGRIYAGIIEEAGIEKVRKMVREGYEVWFTSAEGSDIHRASRLARTLGCRYVPPGMEPPADAVPCPET